MKPDDFQSRRILFFLKAILLIIVVAFLLKDQIFVNADKKEEPYLYSLPTDAHTDFIKKIGQDLKIRKNIELVIVPFVHGVAMLNDLPESYVILVQHDFYYSLSENEQKAVIAHELGHVVYDSSKIILHPTEEMIINDQIGADAIGAKYTSPETMQSVLDKLFKEYVVRTDNLNKLKRAH